MEDAFGMEMDYAQLPKIYALPAMKQGTFLRVLHRLRHESCERDPDTSR